MQSLADAGVVLVLFVVHFAQVASQVVVNTHPSLALSFLVALFSLTNLLEALRQITVAFGKPLFLSLDAGALAGIVFGAAGKELGVERVEVAGQKCVDSIGAAAIGGRIFGIRFWNSTSRTSHVRRCAGKEEKQHKGQ